MTTKTAVQPSHKNKISKLNRIAGQVEGIKKMVEDQRYCVDILTQLRAARSAMRALESEILEKHLQHCVVESLSDSKSKENKIKELHDLFKRFD
jgi:CsoR family transcriptional regulator, copper-sensing transcriptional repressor